MSVESIGRPIGTCFALTAFAIAIAAGLLAQNNTVTVLGRAIVVLVVSRVIGAMLGWVLSRVAAESLDMQERAARVAVLDGSGMAMGIEVEEGVVAAAMKGRRVA